MRIVPRNRASVKPGDKFGRLTVIGEAFYVPMQRQSRQLAICECECGAVVVVQAGSLRSGNTNSCSCLKLERLRSANLKHGESGWRLYKIWTGMRKRCLNPASEKYARYGGRGISICEDWSRFEPFRDWAIANGYADNLTIDRKDSNGDYNPDNCRWATQKQQQRNRTNNVYITAFGESKLAAEWEEDERWSVTATEIRRRIARGLSPEDAISIPPGRASTPS